MRRYHLLKNREYCPTVGVDRLWTLISNKVRKEAWAKPAGSPVPIIDATKAGYFKVLGNGRLPKHPFVLKTKFVSQQAEKKIKSVGGIVVLTA